MDQKKIGSFLKELRNEKGITLGCLIAAMQYALKKSEKKKKEAEKAEKEAEE